MPILFLRLKCDSDGFCESARGFAAMIPESLLSFFSAGRSFIVSTHKDCDGDGLGAGIALCRGLKKIGKGAVFLALEPPHPKYSFLDGEGLVKVCGGEGADLSEGKDLVFVDVSDPRITEPLYSRAKRRGLKICFIDHHPLIQKPRGDLVYTDPGASSSAEIVHKVLKRLGAAMDEKIASALFASIVFDTGRFRDIKNSSAPLALAAECVSFISDVNFVYERLFKTLTARGLRFLSRLQNIEYFGGGRLAFLYLTEKDFKEFGADRGQACGLIELAGDVDTVESAALVIKNADGSFKISLRSRKKDTLPLAKSFGGGGHRHSSGATARNLSLKAVKERIVLQLCGAGA